MANSLEKELKRESNLGKIQTCDPVKLDKQAVVGRDGYKKTKLGWIPEEWEVKQLDDLGKVITGLTYSPEDTDENGILVLRSSNVQNDNLCFEDNVFVNTEKLNYNPVEKGDILICVRNGSKNLIGKNTIITKEVAGVAFGAFMAVYRSELNNYLIHYFKTDLYNNEIYKNLGATINSINGSELKRFKVPLPPDPERQKIATILATWDRAIAKQQQLIAAKQEYKKGLMQLLLTGTLRFEGFEGEWETPQINAVFDFLSTNSFSRSQLNYDEEKGIYNIHYGDIHATYNQSILDFEKENKVPKINGDVILSKNVDFLKNGDLIIADASEDYEGIGKAIELKNVKDKRVVSGLHTFAFRDKKNKTAEGFRSYIFRNSVVKKALKTIATGSKVYGISKGNIQKFRIVLPSMPEQQRIASTLIGADKEIELLQKQLRELQGQKKGLMQQLLTGEIRVKTD